MCKMPKREEAERRREKEKDRKDRGTVERKGVGEGRVRNIYLPDPINRRCEINSRIDSDRLGIVDTEIR